MIHRFGKTLFGTKVANLLMETKFLIHFCVFLDHLSFFFEKVIMIFFVAFMRAYLYASCFLHVSLEVTFWANTYT